MRGELCGAKGRAGCCLPCRWVEGWAARRRPTHLPEKAMGGRSASRLPAGFVVSHSSTMKLWMNGARRVLGYFMTGASARVRGGPTGRRMRCGLYPGLRCAPPRATLAPSLREGVYAPSPGFCVHPPSAGKERRMGHPPHIRNVPWEALPPRSQRRDLGHPAFWGEPTGAGCRGHAEVVLASPNLGNSPVVGVVPDSRSADGDVRATAGREAGATLGFTLLRGGGGRRRGSWVYATAGGDGRRRCSCVYAIAAGVEGAGGGNPGAWGRFGGRTGWEPGGRSRG